MTNVEVVREMYAAFLRRDFAAAMAPIHPDVVWDVTRSPVDDLRGVYHGHAGMTRLWTLWLEAWETVAIEDAEYLDGGEHVFVWTDAQRNRGRASSIEVTMDPYGWVYTFADGRIMRATFFDDRDDALSAAGLAHG